jgi:hypothetical protein
MFAALHAASVGPREDDIESSKDCVVGASGVAAHALIAMATTKVHPRMSVVPDMCLSHIKRKGAPASHFLSA